MHAFRLGRPNASERRGYGREQQLVGLLGAPPHRRARLRPVVPSYRREREVADHVIDECIDDALEPSRRLSFRLHTLQAGGHVPLRPIDGGIEQRLLVTKVVVDGRRADADGAGDRLHARLRHALAVEELDRRREDLFSPIGVALVLHRIVVKTFDN